MGKHRKAAPFWAGLFAMFACVWAGGVPAMGEEAPQPGWECGAKAAVVMDAGSGRVLYEKNAHEPLPMASTTKILTALLTLEQENLDEWFRVDAQAIRVEGSSMGLREGDEVTLRALAYGMLLPSGNDAANAAAVRIAGSLEGFAQLMNERAQELGMSESHFVTPSGLHDPGHYASAYDMALLARHALENPDFAAICGQSSAQVSFGQPPYPRWLKNHNRLLREYPGTVGVKTGFTDAAGRCLVSCVQRGAVRLICVTLNCPDDWNEHRKLYDFYFEALQMQDFSGSLEDITLPVAGGVRTGVSAKAAGSVEAAVLAGETPQVRIIGTPLLFAPVKKGQALGEIQVYSGDVLLAQTPLVAAETVERRPDPPKRFLGLF